MSLLQDAENKKTEHTLEEALEIVGSGCYTNMLALTNGVITLGAMALSQSIYYVIPVIKCELDLNPSQLAILGSIGFIGAMVSSSWMGSLVDTYGRRKLLLLSCTGTFISAILSSLSPNILTLYVMTFATGFMMSGVFGNTYVYVSEFCTAGIRNNKLIIISMVASMANTYSPGVAWLVMRFDIFIPIIGIFNITPWRLIIILNAIPLSVSTAVLLYFPESPKYLLSRGREEEAMESLRRVYEGNHRLPKDTFPVERILRGDDDRMASTNTKESGQNITFLRSMWNQLKEIYTPPFLIYTGIGSLLIFAVIGLYNILYLWLPEEANRLLRYSQSHKDYDITFCEVMHRKGYTREEKCETDAQAYMVSIIIGLAYCLLCLVMLLLVRVYKLKYILAVNMMIACAIGFVVLFSKRLELTLAALGLMTAILGASQPAAYASLVQFFPTRIRATATALCIMFGRLSVPIGSMLYGLAFKHQCTLAYWILSGTLAVLGLINFLTPKKKKETASL